MLFCPPCRAPSVLNFPTQLNGVFTQTSNRRHGRVGHLFQGRFKAILVDSDAYLLELARYVVLNPVRAGMVRKPQMWLWSSYRTSLGLAPAEPFLAVDGLLAQFANRRAVARARYAKFVAEGIKAPSPWRDRNRAIAKAHATGAYSYQQIAEHFGVHFTTVGRIVRGDG